MRRIPEPVEYLISASSPRAGMSFKPLAEARKFNRILKWLEE